MDLRNRMFRKIMNRVESKGEIFNPEIVEDVNEKLSLALNRYANEPSLGVTYQGKNTFSIKIFIFYLINLYIGLFIFPNI